MLINAAFNTRLNVGISIYIQRLIPHLAQLCELTILTPDPEVFQPYGEVIPLPHYVRFTLRRTVWTLTKLTQYCHKSYDILFSPLPALPPFPRIPAIAVIHDLTPRRMYHLITTKEKIAFWLGLQSLRFASVVITDSNFTKSDLLKTRLVTKNRIVVVPIGPGVVPSIESEADNFGQKFAPYILYVGTNAPHKNLLRLISAFARLKPPRNLKLILVGGGCHSQLHQVKAEISRYRLNSQVIMFDELPVNHLSSLYRHCTMVVCPSLYEGFGLPVLEAMVHGAPVACSAVSSLPEVAGEAAVLFNPYSVEDIAEKMQSLLENPQKRAQLGSLGQKRAQIFSWERAAQTIYETALRIL